jgi:hypothetical protein
MRQIHRGLDACWRQPERPGCRQAHASTGRYGVLVEPIRGLATSLGLVDGREASGSEREKASQDAQSSAARFTSSRSREDCTIRSTRRNLAGLADGASSRRPLF